MADKGIKGTPVTNGKAVAPVTPAPSAVADIPKTEVQLMADMQAAVKSGDYKMVAKVASELVKFQKAKEQADMDAKLQALKLIEESVKTAIVKALQPIIDSKKLDAADGVWFGMDFGEKLTTLRLMKSSPKAKGTGGGGGGAGKKFSVSTTELLEKFGSTEYKDGQTYQAAYDSNTDKNWRYAIRESLLKKNGNIT
ncbi:MAG: hypothetical protein KKH61_20570 [Gammaproteobacteria bacterium]|nr:hypothetical protein [Gammaproteobacteria bacterium]